MERSGKDKGVFMESGPWKNSHSTEKSQYDGLKPILPTLPELTRNNPPYSARLPQSRTSLDSVNSPSNNGYLLWNMKEWIGLNINNNLGHDGSGSWLDVFAVTIWWMWNWRNKELFQPPFSRPNSSEPILLEFI
ncbi:hypothetical protein PIB30_098822 [Stylosanthes scabra]|uniref:Uncharacterized protein n=1 Tax=Stylosanthes scabra TaxID=79078 RepID=A0ABU6WWM0_9FABA|nr:hypothetical protein [Stylosanthes scabra]